MTAEIVPLHARREREVPLTYEQLRVYLAQRGIDVSIRWLKYRSKDGMPSYLDVAGKRRFVPSQAMAWLERWAAQKGRDLRPPSASA
jgi:hypothetical protein